MNDYLEKISNIENQLLAVGIDYEKEIVEAIKNDPSQLDKYDLIFAITFGVIGAAITTSDAIQKYLDEIHKLASNESVKDADSLQKLLGKLLNHKGDWIDSGEKYYENIIQKPEYINEFINRDGSPLGRKLGNHRIFWGHDIFSVGADNPFFLSIKQYGLLRGIFKAFGHLIADTCSIQGLPLPGHSWFDYTDSNGKIGNKLFDFCQKYSDEVLKGGNKTSGADQVFKHMFSIRTQDAISQGLTTALSAVYLKARKIQDDIRITQFKLIASFVNFYGGCIIGTIKTGIPYINWPAMIVMIKNNIQLIYISNKETKKLLAKTDLIIFEGDSIKDSVDELDEKIKHDLYYALDGTTNKGRDELIQFYGEE